MPGESVRWSCGLLQVALVQLEGEREGFGVRVGAPELARVEPHRVDVLRVLAPEVRVRVRQYRGGLDELDDSGVPAHVAGEPGVPGRRRVLRATPLTRRERRRGLHGAKRALGSRCVVRLVGYGDRRFLDLLPAEVAGAGLGCIRRQDGAVG